MSRLPVEFYRQDAVAVAEKLLGKVLVRKWDDGTVSQYRITATEAYLGAEDLACHASKGRTPRTDVMFGDGGAVYVYLIYGIYWMLNVVTGTEDHPQAVLICGIDEVIGSGRVGKKLLIDKSFYGEKLLDSDRIWIEDRDEIPEFEAMPRVGIDYAGEIWKNKPWRFVIKEYITPKSKKRKT